MVVDNSGVAHNLIYIQYACTIYAFIYALYYYIVYAHAIHMHLYMHLLYTTNTFVHSLYTNIYIYKIQLGLPAGMLTDLDGFLFGKSFTDTHSCTELMSAQEGHVQKMLFHSGPHHALAFIFSLPALAWCSLSLATVDIGVHLGLRTQSIVTFSALWSAHLAASAAAGAAVITSLRAFMDPRCSASWCHHTSDFQQINGGRHKHLGFIMWSRILWLYC